MGPPQCPHNWIRLLNDRYEYVCLTTEAGVVEVPSRMADAAPVSYLMRRAYHASIQQQAAMSGSTSVLGAYVLYSYVRERRYSTTYVRTYVHVMSVK